MPGLSVVIVYNKLNTFGLEKDAQLLKEGLTRNKCVVKVMDPRESPVVCDLCIHLENPYAVWFPWARTNAILVNGEWWQEGWNGYKDSFDLALFRDPETEKQLGDGFRKTILLRWTCSLEIEPPVHDAKEEFVWFLAGSKNKRSAAEVVLPLWRESYPPLHVYTLASLNVTVASNVTIHVCDLSLNDRTRIAEASGGHVCISSAESFGYTAAEAERVGAFTIMNNLPCYKYAYNATPGCEWVELGVQSDLDNAIETFRKTDLIYVQERRKAYAHEHRKVFLLHMEALVHNAKEAFRQEIINMPPVLTPTECPKISIVTLVHNRPKFIENACLNILHSDYPHEKIEWVVVDDSDADKSASNRIVQFGEKFSGSLKYVPLKKKQSIGEKRNIGVRSSSNDVILMMDDDDHYPTTSFRRRVAWLSKGYECATCTTIAMYDLIKGVSAVNVPPFNLSLAQRCSEATLTFRKSFWTQRPFTDTSMAEGEEFLKGREWSIVEMPPQQIIVALSHNANVGDRKMPAAGNGCFWGFPKPLLEFLHGLVGIKVEEEV